MQRRGVEADPLAPAPRRDPVDHRGVGLAHRGAGVQADLRVGAQRQRQLHRQVLAPLQLLADRLQRHQHGQQLLGEGQERGVQPLPGGDDLRPVGLRAQFVGEAQALVVGARLAGVALDELRQAAEEGRAGGARGLERPGERRGCRVGALLGLARGLALGDVEARAQLGERPLSPPAAPLAERVEVQRDARRVDLEAELARRLGLQVVRLVDD